LAKEDGPHDSYEGSPMSKGAFQFRLWEETRLEGLVGEDCQVSEFRSENFVILTDTMYSEVHREPNDELFRFGIRNPSVTAQMPSSTSTQILDCSESTDPFLSNVFIQGDGEGLIVRNAGRVYSFR